MGNDRMKIGAVVTVLNDGKKTFCINLSGPYV